MLDTMTYVFMDWVAVITNLNSSDTGCLDYETVIECLTCDKKKNSVFHLKTTSCQVSIQVIRTELYAGRGNLFREVEYRFEGSFISNAL